MSERLESAAIKRDGVLHGGGFKSHWEIRAALGDAESNKSKMTDEEGFLTSAGRFVTRREAIDVGIASGQVGEGWRTAWRALLSSNINW